MDAATILDSMREVLRQGEALVLAIDDRAYAEKIAVAFNGSIGGHYRHNLDHFRSVIDGLDADEINYDRRKRDPRIETQRSVALAHTAELLRAAETLTPAVLERSVQVRAKVSYAADESASAPSTVGREVMFAVVHAIHHNAIIGVMCGLLGLPQPDGFGVAPSTLKHHRGSAAQAENPHGKVAAYECPIRERTLGPAPKELSRAA